MRKLSSRSIVILAIIFGFIVVGAFFFQYYFSKQFYTFYPDVEKINQARNAGDFSTVLTQSQSILQDPTKSADEKAKAVIATNGAEFHISGNVQDRLKDLAALKQIITDPSISVSTRVDAINAYAYIYENSGKDPVVFAEMFKDEPFSKYRDQAGDPYRSELNLFAWSYSLLPTVDSASHIANLYSYMNSGLYPTMTESTAKANATIAARYLVLADTLEQQSEANSPDFKIGSRYIYIDYLIMKATTIGNLAKTLGSPYKEQYRTAFDAYITFALQTNTSVTQQNLFFVRFSYAAFLIRIDNDTKTAKAQLDQLSKDLAADKNPNVNGFVRYLMNSYKDQTGHEWSLIKSLFPVSAAFQAEANKLVASAPSSAAQ